MERESEKLASAVIRVKDRQDGTLDIDVNFAPDIKNDSLAHRLVQRFIEFINTPQVEKGATAEQAGVTKEGG